MKSFSSKIIHLWTAKNFSLYARFSSHAVKIIRHLAFWTHRYFHRLSEEVTLFIPLFLLFLISVNIGVPKNSFEILKESVQINSSNFNSHFLLAKKFIAANQYSLAQKELAQIPGNHDEEINQIEILKNEPVRIQKEVLIWQQLTNLNPSDRDGYIKLAILNWKLYRNFDAQKFLTEALKIDPNNEKINKLEANLK